MAKKMRKVRKDRRVFRHTANKTRKLNVRPKIMRGGIRL